MQRLPRITRFRVDQCLQPAPCTDAPLDPSAPTEQTDVVIIGTGFAGLTAARELQSGRSVIVRELVLPKGTRR